MKKIKTYNSGFTLIELVVVIAIIGIIGGAVFLSINPAQLLSSSRDTTRKSDLKNLSTAISKAIANQDIRLVAMDYSNINNYTSLGQNTKVDGTGYVKYEKLNQAFTKLDINKLPLDPSNTLKILNSEVQYKVAYCSDGKDFEVNVSLENDTKNEMGTDGGDNPRAYELGTALNLCPASVF